VLDSFNLVELKSIVDSVCVVVLVSLLLGRFYLVKDWVLVREQVRVFLV